MLKQTLIGSGIALGAILAVALSAEAVTMQECSTKYQTAKKANQLKGQKWNDFRKAQCADDDASENDAAAAVQDAPTAPAAAPAPAEKGKAAQKAARPGQVVLPNAVAAKYSNETPGRARLKTCADQYNANKERGANGDLKWIQTGGGYWSQCNAKLKS